MSQVMRDQTETDGERGSSERANFCGAGRVCFVVGRFFCAALH